MHTTGLGFVADNALQIDGVLTIRSGATGLMTALLSGAGTTAGAVEIYDGDGDGYFEAQVGARVQRYVSFQGPTVGATHGGENTLIISGSQVGSFVSLVGGSGRDLLGVANNSFVASNVELDGYDAPAGTPESFLIRDSLVGGNVIHKGLTPLATGTPSPSTTNSNILTEVIRSTITGGVSINDSLATSGSNRVEIIGTSSTRFLSVVTGGSADGIRLAGVATPVAVNGNVILRQGDGNDTVSTDFVRFNVGFVEITQAAGNDQANLQNAGSRTTEFFGPFTYNGNEGDDTVVLGNVGAPAGQAIFRGTSSFHGGVGPLDILDRTNGLFPGAAPTIIEFEVIIPSPEGPA